MKIAIFSTQAYDRHALDEANKQFNSNQLAHSAPARDLSAHRKIQRAGAATVLEQSYH